MKARLFVVTLFIVVMALLPASGTLAQGPEPTPPPSWRMVSPPSPEPAVQPRLEFGASQDRLMSRELSLSRTATPRVLVPTLGAPGTSLRFIQSFGVTGQGYPAPGTTRLNAPGGLFIDAANQVYVTEDRGYRVLRYTQAGVNNLAIGTPGTCIMSATPPGFCPPQDVALDGAGNMWIADGNRIAQYSAAGAYLDQLPAVATVGAPWSSGTDNTHFDTVWGVTIDITAKSMFVADGFNHRVQIYDITASPVYSATIGVTGVPGSDATHLNQPRRLTIDSLGNLYIVDSGNGRVQRCVPGTWSCTTFASGLSDPQGIGRDSTDNIYIADSNNRRIVKCTSAGACSDLITGLPGWVSDVAVDSAGTIYVSDWNHAVVRKYTSAGTVVGIFVGIEDGPYVADAASINTPWGVAVAADNSIYIGETNGNRLLKLNAAGAQVWTIGQPGVIGPLDKTHFAGPQGSLALDSAGRVYVPDTQNFRIQVFNSDSTWYKTFGGFGTGPYELNLPSGVAIASNGDIYVVDRGNQRIQVYTSSWNYKATLGTTGTLGSDGTHFWTPYAVAVDSSGKVYVADADNHRVQKCTMNGSGGTCVTIVGVTGEKGWDFGHLEYPTGVAVDNNGRLYIADRRNNRVQVFTTAGAYLTTVAGSWGTSSGQMRSPSGVAVDSSGNIWVTDQINHRVEKLAVGVSGWVQDNINGFGDPGNIRVTALAPFANQLYAGVFNNNGAGLYREKADGTWESVAQPGFGNPANVAIDSLLSFGNNLYASTWSSMAGGNSGEVWRYNGSTWTKVVAGGFGDASNGDIFTLASFGGKIYASTWSVSHGGEVWSSATGDSGSWTRVVQNGFGTASNNTVASFQSFGGYLYAGTDNPTAGGEVYRSNNGTTWTKINSSGFGLGANRSISALAEFKGSLYAGVQNTTSGMQIWRCQQCSGGDWIKVADGGFGDIKNTGEVGLEAVTDFLFVTTTNADAGIKIWKSGSGDPSSWVGALAFPGFGDQNNTNGYYDHALTIFDNRVVVGTRNAAHGGEVWQTTEQFTPPVTPPTPPATANPMIYLPLITR